jgi:hypothetical protein
MTDIGFREGEERQIWLRDGIAREKQALLTCLVHVHLLIADFSIPNEPLNKFTFRAIRGGNRSWY